MNKNCNKAIAERTKNNQFYPYNNKKLLKMLCNCIEKKIQEKVFEDRFLLNIYF